MKSIRSAHRNALSCAILAAALMLTACASVSSPQPIAVTISANPELSTLSGLIAKAGLANTLNSAQSITVFAPSNEAFKSVSAKSLEELLANPARLTEVLNHHVMANKAMSQDVKSGSVKTVHGSSLAIAKAGAHITVEDAIVQTADITATNGVVHIIDRVMIPPVRK